MIVPLQELHRLLPGIDHAFYDYENAASCVRIKNFTWWTDDDPPIARLRLTPDGTKAAIVRIKQKDVEFYHLSTPWDLMTGVYCYSVDLSEANLMEYKLVSHGYDVARKFMRFIGAA